MATIIQFSTESYTIDGIEWPCCTDRDLVIETNNREKSLSSNIPPTDILHQSDKRGQPRRLSTYLTE